MKKVLVQLMGEGMRGALYILMPAGCAMTDIISFLRCIQRESFGYQSDLSAQNDGPPVYWTVSN